MLFCEINVGHGAGLIATLCRLHGETRAAVPPRTPSPMAGGIWRSLETALGQTDALETQVGRWVARKPGEAERKHPHRAAHKPPAYTPLADRVETLTIFARGATEAQGVVAGGLHSITAGCPRSVVALGRVGSTVLACTLACRGDRRPRRDIMRSTVAPCANLVCKA